METGIFYPVKGYEGFYEISKHGIIRSVERVISTGAGNRKILSHVISTRINNCGYVEIRLSKEGNRKSTFLHVLLAKVFIPNPEEKPEINHKNGVKTDNSLENLEWVSHSENVRHAYNLGLCKKHPKRVIDINTGEIYRSLKEASEKFLIPYSTCKNYLNGNRSNPTSLRLVA